MKYIVTYETSCRYDRNYMIAAICSKPESAEKKVVALKKQITKFHGAQHRTRDAEIGSIKVTPWDGKSPIIAFQFLY